MLTDGVIVLDSKEIILNEWISCASFGDSLTAWVDEMILNGKITLIDYSNDSNLSKKIKILGMPTKDRKYVQLAFAASAKAIVTNDIDFYSPEEKGCTSERAKIIKNKKLGKVCKFLKKDLGVLVCDWLEIKEI